MAVRLRSQGPPRHGLEKDIEMESEGSEKKEGMAISARLGSLHGMEEKSSPITLRQGDGEKLL